MILEDQNVSKDSRGWCVAAQLIEHLSHKEFQKCAARYDGDRHAKKLSCWEQYLAMVLAQLTYRRSLRDIEACLGAVDGKLYHMGFNSGLVRPTLADANENRDWHIYADFAHTLIATARQLYTVEASHCEGNRVGSNVGFKTLEPAYLLSECRQCRLCRYFPTSSLYLYPGARCTLLEISYISYTTYTKPHACCGFLFSEPTLHLHRTHVSLLLSRHSRMTLH